MAALILSAESCSSMERRRCRRTFTALLELPLLGLLDDDECSIFLLPPLNLFSCLSLSFLPDHFFFEGDERLDETLAKEELSEVIGSMRGATNFGGLASFACDCAVVVLD